MKISGPVLVAKLEYEGTSAEEDKSVSVDVGVKGENKIQGQDIFQKKTANMKALPEFEVRLIPGNWKISVSICLLSFIVYAVLMDINIQSVSLLLLFLALLSVLDAWTTIGDMEKINKIKYEAKRSKQAEQATSNKPAETV